MDPESVAELVRSHIEGSEVQVQAAGSHYDVLVVSGTFEGKRPVQRQQLVYAALNEAIASGRIHAVNIRALTPEQRRESPGA